MMNQHMPAGPGQHIPPAIPHHPHSRREQGYHTYHHPAPPPSPIHHPYANYPIPAQYYSHPQGPPPQYPPQRWQHPYHAPQYMPPPAPQQAPFQPRSPMVVSSQPYGQPMTPVTRQTPIPPPPPPQQQTAPSPRAIQQNMPPQQNHTPVAASSPAPTPKQEQAPKPQEATPSPQPTARRASVPMNPLMLPPEYKTPFYPDLPWYSVNDAPFPPRASTRRRRRQNLNNIDSVALPIRETRERETQEQTLDEQTSETSTIAAPSEPETPATSQAPSEGDFTQVSAPPASAQAAITSPKTTPQQSQHARRDTKTAIAVPNIPGFNRPRPSPPAAQRQEAPPSQDSSPTPTPDVQMSTTNDGGQTSEETAVSVSPPPKPAPKSWADLVRRNTTTTTSGAVANRGTIINGASLPKSASLSDALKQYSVQIDAKLSFLEPRGLVNTGNMCYMNSVGSITLSSERAVH